MSSDPIEQARDSDAPLTAAKHQHELADQAADALHWDRAAVFGRTVTIDRPRAELYAFWRDFRNLARFMENIESVTLSDDRRSHWVVKAPGGKSVEWDSVLIEDIENERLAWASDEGADIRNTGEVVFRDAPPGRGTEVTATIIYEPPAGEAGVMIAKLFGKEPKGQARRDLRRFKQLMETGEVSTSKAPDAAPRGGAQAIG